MQKHILDLLKIKRFVVFKHRNVGIMKPNGSYIPLAFGEKATNRVQRAAPCKF